DAGALGFVDVLDPAQVRIHRVHGEGDHLDAALGELVGQIGGVAQLGGADRGEVGGVREEDAPAVAEPLVEADAAFAGVLLEIGGDVSEADARGGVSCKSGGVWRGGDYAASRSK